MSTKEDVHSLYTEKHVASASKENFVLPSVRKGPLYVTERYPKRKWCCKSQLENGSLPLLSRHSIYDIGLYTKLRCNPLISQIHCPATAQGVPATDPLSFNLNNGMNPFPHDIQKQAKNRPTANSTFSCWPNALQPPLHRPDVGSAQREELASAMDPSCACAKAWRKAVLHLFIYSSALFFAKASFSFWKRNSSGTTPCTC